MRKSMNELLGIKHSNDVAYLDEIPSKEDVERFEEDNTGGPQLKPMRPYWDDLNSSWNDQLCELFLQHLTSRLEEDTLGLDNEAEIEDMFRQRLRSLRREVLKTKARRGEKSSEISGCLKQAHLKSLVWQRPNTRHSQVSTPKLCRNIEYY